MVKKDVFLELRATATSLVTVKRLNQSLDLKVPVTEPPGTATSVIAFLITTWSQSEGSQLVSQTTGF